MIEEGRKLINIYEINDKKINKKKILIILIIILIIIMLVGILIYTLDYMEKYKIYQKYMEQFQQIQEEENQKKHQIEEKLKENQKLPQLTQEGINNIQKIYKSDTKRVFLTFDDGPSKITPQILDVLKKENVKATFFVLGSNVEAMPEMVQRIYEEGHYIANHGYSHVYEQIYSSPQAVLEEFNKCNEAVKKAINQPQYNSHLFRFPGGLAGGKYSEVKKQAKTLLNENNIVNVDWNALTGDSEKNNAPIEFLLQRLQETIRNQNSIVILMHDAQAKQTTADALPQVIQYLREQGYEFKNFYEIIK